MGFRSQIGSLLRVVLARNGFSLVRDGLHFGIDPWIDIARLASDWSYPVSCIFDVGTNDGEVASLALHRFPHAKVVGFEPHPSTFVKLQNKIGNEPRFTAVNLALGTEKGEVSLIEYEGDDKVSSLLQNAPYAVRFQKSGRGVNVQCTTLDSYCALNGIQNVDVLKIDTEGFDLAVLQGGVGMLRQRAVKFIYTEFNDLQQRDDAFGGALLPMDEFLRPFGYRFIASYNDYIVTSGELFSVSNALFALPPK